MMKLKVLLTVALAWSVFNITAAIADDRVVVHVADAPNEAAYLVNGISVIPLVTTSGKTQYHSIQSPLLSVEKPVAVYVTMLLEKKDRSGATVRQYYDALVHAYPGETRTLQVSDFTASAPLSRQTECLDQAYLDVIGFADGSTYQVNGRTVDDCDVQTIINLNGERLKRIHLGNSTNETYFARLAVLEPDINGHRRMSRNVFYYQRGDKYEIRKKDLYFEAPLLQVTPTKQTKESGKVWIDMIDFPSNTKIKFGNKTPETFVDLYDELNVKRGKRFALDKATANSSHFVLSVDYVDASNRVWRSSSRVFYREGDHFAIYPSDLEKTDVVIQAPVFEKASSTPTFQNQAPVNPQPPALSKKKLPPVKVVPVPTPDQGWQPVPPSPKETEGTTQPVAPGKPPTVKPPTVKPPEEDKNPEQGTNIGPKLPPPVDTPVMTKGDPGVGILKLRVPPGAKIIIGKNVVVESSKSEIRTFNSPLLQTGDVYPMLVRVEYEDPQTRDAIVYEHDALLYPGQILHLDAVKRTERKE